MNINMKKNSILLLYLFLAHVFANSAFSREQIATSLELRILLGSEGLVIAKLGDKLERRPQNEDTKGETISYDGKDYTVKWQKYTGGKFSEIIYISPYTQINQPLLTMNSLALVEKHDLYVRSILGDGDKIAVNGHAEANKVVVLEVEKSIKGFKVLAYLEGAELKRFLNAINYRIKIDREILNHANISLERK